MDEEIHFGLDLQVNSTRLLELARTLSSLPSRYSYGTHNEAGIAANLCESLLSDTGKELPVVPCVEQSSWCMHQRYRTCLLTMDRCNLGRAGLSVQRQTFRGLRPTQQLHNVMARIPSRDETNHGDVDGSLHAKTIIVAAHYDSTNARPGPIADDDLPAPGADDNASGVAVVVHICELLARAYLKGSFAPSSAIVFILFGAEEQGAWYRWRRGRFSIQRYSVV